MKTADENEIDIALNAFDTAINSAVSSTPIASQLADGEATLEGGENKLEKLKKQKEQIEQHINPQLKSEALIVAALMGNSIVRLQKKNNSRFMQQLSSPPAITITSATAGQPSDLRNSNQSLNRMRSHLSSQSQQTTSFSHDQLNTNDMLTTCNTDVEGGNHNQQLHIANATAATSATANALNRLFYSKSNQANAKLNTTNNNTSTTITSTSSKALKCMLLM